MKIRPQIQLRFRDVEQHERVKRAAAEAAVSVNEWIVRRLEAVDGVQGKAWGEGRAEAEAVSGGAEERTASDDKVESGNEEIRAKAETGFKKRRARKERVQPVKEQSPAKRTGGGKICKCGNVMMDWGRVWKCNICRTEVPK
jgi:hypothetical protein